MTSLYLLLTDRLRRRTLLLAGTILMLAGTISLGALIRSVFDEPVIAAGCRAASLGTVSNNITTPVTADRLTTTW